MEYSNGYPDTAHCCRYPFRHYVGFNDQLHASTVLLSNHTTDNSLPVTCSQHGYFRTINPDVAVWMEPVLSSYTRFIDYIIM